MEEWKECLRWLSDDKPETTEAVVLVSSQGRVKSLSYKHWNGKNNGYSTRQEKVYMTGTNRGKQRYETDTDINRGKYQHVSIRNRSYSIHRLVAKAFIANPDNKPQVNHIDGNRSNNNYKNLEWVTNKENADHAHNNGMRDHIYEASIKIDGDVKKIIDEHLSNGISATRISDMINNSVSHETIRMYKLKYFSGTKTKRKKRSSQSRETTDNIRKKWKLNYVPNTKSVEEITAKYNYGYLKSELNMPGSDMILSFLKKEGAELKFHKNSALLKAIKTPSMGVSKKGNGYRFRFGRNFSRQGFLTKEEAISWKYIWLAKTVENKPRLQEEVIKWAQKLHL